MNWEEKYNALAALVDGYRRERDEARAEVERLRARIEHIAQSHVVALNLARREGAEAMREACAQWVNDYCSSAKARAIRALPIPEEP